MFENKLSIMNIYRSSNLNIKVYDDVCIITPDANIVYFPIRALIHLMQGGTIVLWDRLVGSRSPNNHIDKAADYIYTVINHTIENNEYVKHNITDIMSFTALVYYAIYATGRTEPINRSQINVSVFVDSPNCLE